MPKFNLTRSIEKYFRDKGLPSGYAVTFADVFIVDRTSRVSRRSDIGNVKAALAERVTLNVPLISANMMDVTESRMAIALARMGGIGFIHQFLPIAARIEEVKKVKRAENEIIENPWSVREDETLSRALAFAREKGISGVLVVDREGKLAGIFTARDARFALYRMGDRAADVKVGDVMTKMPLVTGRPGIGAQEAVRLMGERKVEKLPLINRAGKPMGLMTARDILKRSDYPAALRDKNGQLMAGASVGISHDAVDEAAALIRAGADMILVDTARANSLRARDLVRTIRKKFPRIALAAGNVDNAEGALLLAKAGADCVKVGIGPGSACKTRTETGVGSPQLSAIAECAAAARLSGISVIADGGVRDGASFAKALVAGADAVMLGGLLAGTDETPGEVYYDSGERYKLYRGSAGLDSQVARFKKGGLDGVRAPEGVTRKIAFKGESAVDIVSGLLANLRSSMSYANAVTLEEFHSAKFRVQSRAGYEEGMPRQ